MSVICTLLIVAETSAASSAVSITPLPNAGGVAVRRPTAVAYDARGRLFIADGAGNRILVVAPNRPPVLFAGSASGEAGDADGPAERARFNDPSGLAIGPQGEIFVADAGNHAVRAITPAGVVSTLAGTPSTARVDGPRAKAAFIAPVGVATDDRGDVFVADRGAGIREIKAQGDVVTLQVPVHEPTAVAVGESVTLFASDSDGIVIFRLSDGTTRRIPSAPRVGPGIAQLQGQRPLGTPLALAAIDSSSVLYSTADGAVHYLDADQGFTRTVADGPLLGDPVALARDRSGSVAVAEGSGSIALVAGVNLRKPIVPSDAGLLPNHFKLDPSDYNVAFVGASFVWWDTGWDDSMQGILEDALLREPNGRRLKPHVVPVVMPGGTLQACEQYSQFLGDLGTVRLIVLDVSRTLVAQSFRVSSETIALDRTAWEPKFIDDLTKLRLELASDQTQLLVVVHPEEPDMVGQAEGISFLAKDLQAHGVRAMNLYPDFGRASGSAQLFNSVDPHFSADGRRLEADAVAREIESGPPWADPSKVPVVKSTQRATSAAQNSAHPVSAVTMNARKPARRSVAGPNKPRFLDAWASLNSALWMLTHTSAARATDANYQRGTREIYAAIGALDDGIISSTRKADEPADPPNDVARVRAALNLLDAADSELAAPSSDRNAEALRVRALDATREARTAVASLVDACGC